MIKNIILDFGDVLINLDKGATARAMVRYGFTHVSDELALLFNDYEKGNIRTAEFLEAASAQFPGIDKAALISAWNAILLDFPEHRLEFLEELAQGGRYRLLLLSNTNELHMEEVRRQMGQERYHRFRNAFEVFYLSYEMGMRKPDSEIFEYVLGENGLSPTETIFVDDLAENTRAAARLGIQVWNLQLGKEDVIQLKSRLNP